MAALAEETFSALASTLPDLLLLDADFSLLDADFSLLDDALLILDPFDDDESENDNDLYDLVLMTVLVVLADFPVVGEVALPWMDLPALDGTGKDMECDRIGADLLAFPE